MASGRLRIGQLGPGQYSLSAESATFNLNGQAATLTHLGGEAFLFHDDFSSGDRTHSENGISWLGSHNTSVVADAGNASGFALQFRFSDPSSGSSFAEQRFDLDANDQGTIYPELWVRYRILIPSNFFHPSDGVDNNKWFRLWSGDQSDGNGGYGQYYIKGGASLIPISNGQSEIIIEYGTSTDGVGSNGANIYSADFILTEDFGQELDIVIHMKADTVGTPGGDSDDVGGNGAFEIWKNGNKVTGLTTIKNRPISGTNGYNRGYFMGADNTDYANGEEMTVFLIREVWFSETNVFGVS